MSWVKIDDAFPFHPKVAGLSNEAFRTHVSALCYCAHYLTDGVLPFALPWFECEDELIASGLWKTRKRDASRHGYVIHDYLQYNPSRESVLAERAAAAERMRLNRERRAEKVRANGAGTSPYPVPVPQVPTELKRGRAYARREELPAGPQPPKFTGRCESCGSPTADHYPDCKGGRT